MDKFKEDNPKLGRLREILYRQGSDGRTPREDDPLLEKHYGVPEDWPRDEVMPKDSHTLLTSQKRRLSFGGWFFLFSIFFAFGSALFAYFVFFGDKNSISQENVLFTINASNFTEGGVPLPLEISIENKNKAPLEEAILSLTYERGEKISGGAPNERVRKVIGVIPPKDALSLNERIVLFGGEGSERLITATLNYRIPNSNAVYKKEATFPIIIKSPPVLLSLTAPESVGSGQPFSLTFQVKGKPGTMLERVIVVAEYPTGFSFDDASLNPSAGERIWIFDGLKEAGQTVTINGRLTADDGTDRVFRVYVGEGSGEAEDPLSLVYNLALKEMVVSRPFLNLSLSSDGVEGREFVARAGGGINLNLNYSSEGASERLDDVVIRAKLSGAVLDRNQVSVQDGFFDSTQNTLIWDRSTVPAFAVLSPGKTGRLSFYLAGLPSITETGGLIRDPSIFIEFSVNARRDLETGVPERITFNEKYRIKFGTEVNFGGTIISPAEILAEKQSVATLNLSLANTANRLSDSEVSFSLPNYVALGSAIVPGNNFDFDERSRVVTWRIGDLEPGTGFLSQAQAASFELVFVPSIIQRGENIPLIENPIFRGFDTFTGETVSLPGRINEDVRVAD